MNSLENKAVKIIMDKLQDVSSKLSKAEYLLLSIADKKINVEKQSESIRKYHDELSNGLNDINNWLHSLKENKTR